MPSDKPEIKIRASPAQIEAWKAQAKAGESFNAWAVRVLDEATVEGTSAPPAAAERDASKDLAPESADSGLGDFQPPPVDEPQTPSSAGWKPATEEIRQKILAQKPPHRPPGYTDEEWIAMTPLARAARAAEASRH